MSETIETVAVTESAAAQLDKLVRAVSGLEQSGALEIMPSKTVYLGDDFYYPATVDLSSDRVNIAGMADSIWVEHNETAMTPGVGLCDPLIVAGRNQTFFRHNVRATPNTLVRNLSSAQRVLGDEFVGATILSRETEMWPLVVKLAHNMGVDTTNVRFGLINSLGRRDMYRTWVRQCTDDVAIMATTHSKENTPLDIVFTSASEVAKV